MMVNRSAPPGPIVPWLVYEDVSKAIEWLSGAFGFRERLRTRPEPNGAIHHAQLAAGQGCVVLTSGRGGEGGPGLFVHVEDVDSHYEHAKKFGAKIVNPLKTHEFGERQYSAEDFAGRRWTFSQSVADVDPVAWGAVVAKIESPPAQPSRAILCYVEIPAVDVHQSAAFYEKVFGWNIRHRDTDRPSFDDVPGRVSGAWVTGRPISRDPGLLPYIWVADSIDETLKRAISGGGQVVDAPHPDHPGGNCWIATFRDPAGNLIGLYQENVQSPA